MSGKKREIQDLHHKDSRIKSAAERKILNTYCQGTAADLIKVAMIHLHEELTNNPTFQIKSINGINPAARMVLQLHDELIFEVHENYVEKIAFLVKDKMENSTHLKVSTPVKIKIGKNWSDMNVYLK